MTTEYIIEASRGWLRIPWRELIQYRDLLFLLVRRDFISRYKQTLLGPLWFIIQPLTTTLMFTLIDKVANIPTDHVPPVLFNLCGLMAWGYFSQCLGGTSSTFVGNAGLFGKVYFPRLIIPLSVVVSNLMSYAIQLGTFLFFWVWLKLFTTSGSSFHLTVLVFALPLLVLHTAAIGLGVGLWMSALTAKYRDFSHLASFMTQIWMLATPVMYPLSAVPWKWQWVSALNPMTAVVELYKVAFLGAGTVSWLHTSISIGMTLVILVTGLLIFTKTEKTFIDTV